MAAGAVTGIGLLGTGYTLIIVTSSIIIARLCKALVRPKELKAEDYLLFVAYAFFMELTVLYIIVTPIIFRLAAVADGQLKPYPTIMQDSLKLQTYFFVTTSSLWLCLWMVKFSLLSLYKRLLTGKTYLIAWWAIMTFCVLVLIGSIISSWESCSSFHAWFTPGACNTPRDDRAATISLYFSYSVDLLTDLMIMVLPLRLIWNLHMTLNQKRSVGALFCIGWFCIIVATIRVVELGNNQRSGRPSPAWLALWAIIEASIAVIIGCCPGLYRSYKAHGSKSDPTSYRYGSRYGYQWHSGDVQTSRSFAHGGRDIPLSQISAKVKNRGSTTLQGSADPYWHDADGSQEQLAEHIDGENIMITQRVSVTVSDQKPHAASN